MCAAVQHQRNQEATCHVSNLDSRVSEDLLWELFVQCGPISSVFMPKDKVTGTHYGYGFVEFKQASDAAYAHKIMNMVKLFSAPMRVSRSSMDRSVEIGANLFVGNLDLMVNEKLLYDTFSTFGTVLRATVRKGEGVGSANGGSGAATQFGFISYDSFEASDLAIQCMNGQFLCNRQVRVQYALKKGSKTERHGSQAERLLAAEMQAKKAEEKGFRSGSNSAAGGKSPVTGAYAPNSQAQFHNFQQQQQQQQQQRQQTQMHMHQMPPPMARPPPLPQYGMGASNGYQQNAWPGHQQQHYFGTAPYLMHPPPLPMQGLPPPMPAPPPLPQQYRSPNGRSAPKARRPMPPAPPRPPAPPPPPPK